MNAINLNKAIERHFDRLYTKYYHPNHKIFTTHDFMLVTGFKSDIAKFHIELLLNNGEKIKTGYTDTQIRGVHERFIFY